MVGGLPCWLVHRSYYGASVSASYSAASHLSWIPDCWRVSACGLRDRLRARYHAWSKLFRLGGPRIEARDLGPAELCPCRLHPQRKLCWGFSWAGWGDYLPQKADKEWPQRIW